MDIFTKYSKTYRAVVSAFVLVVLSAQAATLVFAQLIGQRGTTGARYWPILVYDMYAKTRHEGDVIDVRYLLDAVTSDGRVVSISPERLGLDFWHFVALTRGLVSEYADSQLTLSQLLHEAYPEQRFVEARVKSYPLKLTRNGAVPAEPVVIHTAAVAAYEK